MFNESKKNLLFITIILLNLAQISAQQPVKLKKDSGNSGALVSAAFPKPSAAPLPSAPVIRSETYTMDVVMNYAKHSLAVEQVITYPNRTNITLDSLTLAVPPNLIADCFELTRLWINNIPVDSYTLNGQRLEIPLQTPLEPDSTIELNLRFNISLPYLSRFNTIDAQVFGYTDVQANLVNWYPFVVPLIDGEWILHDPWYFGEHLVYPSADYTVNLLFTGEANAPVVAAGSSAERVGQFTRYTLRDARSFALSISPYFETSSMEAGGVTINSYYLPVYKTTAEAAMRTAAQAVEIFNKEFGAYPREMLSIVQADLNDSREFSGMSFISRNFYQQYDGSEKNTLTFAAIHTTAHQWWSDAVGNDPALEPWLDEALATYSEMIYFENTDADALAYWHKNRLEFFRPQGDINISIYETGNYETYRQAVYFNGVNFLLNLREQTGVYQFQEFLRDYFQKNFGKIVKTEDFFEILNKHTSENIPEIKRKYFW